MAALKLTPCPTPRHYQWQTSWELGDHGAGGEEGGCQSVWSTKNLKISEKEIVNCLERFIFFNFDEHLFFSIIVHQKLKRGLYVKDRPPEKMMNLCDDDSVCYD
jgi:hypothetical protein